MFGTIKLGKVFGIDLIIHGTFWLLPLFVFFSGVVSGDVTGAALGVFLVLAIFTCVALHELGHALAAAFYGVNTRDITLYPLGGIARLERMPEKPVQEIVIALAGPAVNVVIAFALFSLMFMTGMDLPRTWTLETSTPELLLGSLMKANVYLVLFNLLPAFPMDGGRVLRAALSSRMPRLRATRWAANVGAVLAVLFVLGGIIKLRIDLILVGVVVYLLGQAELAQVRMVEEHREWERAYGDAYDLPPEPAPAPTPAPVPVPAGFTGWKWDPIRRVWSEYRNGVLLRELFKV